MESPSARLIMCRKPKSENRAPLLLRDRVHDLLVAARHQHIGDRLLDRFPFRDREQMRLAFGAGVLDQGIGLDPLGLLEHGSGDFDRIVKGKLMDDVNRGAVETSASRLASWARAATSISSASRPITSPKVHISSSL